MNFKRIATIVLAFLAAMTAIPSLGQDSFPYPKVPDTLRTVNKRAEYVVMHYWDKFNFSDTTLIHKPDITEQGMANFLDLLPRVDSSLVVRGASHFADMAFGADKPKNVCAYFARLIDHYLYSPNSPMRNDRLYAAFLRRMKDISTFDEAERERYSFRLRNVTKNLPGTKAADFAFVDRHGKRSSLYEVKSKYTVLYFNDPDCDNCHRITAELSKEPLLTSGHPDLKVIAVYPDADTDEWLKHPQPFPKKWTDAYSPDGDISARLLYYIRATPTIYLLDSDKRVMLKDPSPELLLDALKQLNIK